MNTGKVEKRRNMRKTVKTKLRHKIRSRKNPFKEQEKRYRKKTSDHQQKQSCGFCFKTIESK